MSAAADFDRMILDFMNDDRLFGTYIQFSDPVYDTTTGENSSIKTETPVQLILLDFDRIINGQSSKYGTDILQGDKDCYMLPTNKANPAAPLIIPNPTRDLINVAGTTYKIVIMKEANPEASAPLLYNMMLRR
jgi:hypothetical protein